MSRENEYMKKHRWERGKVGGEKFDTENEDICLYCLDILCVVR